MYNIYVRIQDQITEIVISGDLLLHQLLAQFQMVLIHIADSDQTGTGIVHMATTHTTCTNDTLRQLITRGDKSITQHVARHDRKSRNSTQGLQEVSSVCLHSTTIIKLNRLITPFIKRTPVDDGSNDHA